jgi:hypothetical protein
MENPRDIFVLALEQISVTAPGQLAVTLSVYKNINFLQPINFFISRNEKSFVVKNKDTEKTLKTISNVLSFFENVIIYGIQMHSSINYRAEFNTLTLFNCNPSTNPHCFESSRVESLKLKAINKIQRGIRDYIENKYTPGGSGYTRAMINFEKNQLSR